MGSMQLFTFICLVLCVFCQPLLAQKLASSSRTEQDPDDVSCSTSGTRGVPPKLCPSGMVCVLNDFGNPPVDIPNSGTCRKLTSPAPPCSVDFCSMEGVSGICTVTGETATCGAWATRRDNEAERPNCNIGCPRDCPRNAVSSDGSIFCNACTLKVASCEAGFTFTGPLTLEEACGGETIGVFLAAFCCREAGIGCLEVGDRCSTSGSLLPPVPCKDGLTCILTDFGFPAVDNPTLGFCAPTQTFPKCTVFLCAKRGGRAVCDVDGIAATCTAWATRTDGGPGPDCSFSCKQYCSRSKATHKVGLCRFCIFAKRSCEKDFTLKYRK